MTTHASESQKLEQDAVVELIDIIHSSQTWRFTRTPADIGAIRLDGNTYFGRDFELEDFEITVSDPLPRPLFTVDNVSDTGTGGFFTNAIATNNDLKGATVRFREIYAANLDDGADPDATQAFTDLTYVIHHMKVVHRTQVEWELKTPPDQEQIMFGRPIYRNLCQREYRVPDPDNPDTFIQSTCPWGNQTLRPGTGGTYYNQANEVEASWLNDSCPLTLVGCRTRFGTDVPLPMQAAPNIGKRS